MSCLASVKPWPLLTVVSTVAWARRPGISKMRAVLVMDVPLGSGLLTVTTRLAEPELPGTRSPRFQVTMPPVAEHRPTGSQLANVVLAGVRSEPSGNTAEK